MIIVVDDSDIFSAPVHCLVNPVNCMGVSGKGLAKDFKDIYPKNFEAYNDYCKKNLLEAGKVFLFREEDGTVIANLATKYHWRYPSNYIWIKKGLIDLKEKMLAYDICSVAIGKIGCGLGGLSWDIVKDMIFEVFENEPLVIFVYE